MKIVSENTADQKFTLDDGQVIQAHIFDAKWGHLDGTTWHAEVGSVSARGAAPRDAVEKVIAILDVQNPAKSV